MPPHPIADIKLAQAIVVDPLVVSPDIAIADAIARMSDARATCTVFDQTALEENHLQTNARASCLLVMAESQLVGVFTERDVVRLSASGQSLHDSPLAAVMTRSVVTLRQSEFTDIFVALQLLQRHRIRHLPILDDQNQLVGLLTHETLRQLLRPIDLLRLRVVSEVMIAPVIYATPETLVLDLARLMAEHRVGSIVIVEPQAVGVTASESQDMTPLLIPVGIVTEGDIVQFQALNLSFQQIQAASVMSTPVFTVRPSDSLWVAQRLIQQKRLSRVIVVGDQGELEGIVTQSTLLQALNPVEIYNLVDLLEQKVSRLEAEKTALLRTRNTELEGQVRQRTEALKRQTEREQLLNTIATRIRASLRLQDTLDVIVSEVRQFLHCDRVLIYQFNPDWSGKVVAESVLPEWESALNHTITDSCFKEKTKQLYAQGKQQAVSNINEAGYPDCYIQLLQRYQIKANLVVPVLVEQQLWGLLLGHQCEHTRTWDLADLELLDRIAVQVAIAIQQAQAYEQTQKEIAERRQAEHALRHSEVTRNALIQSIPDLLVRTNRRGEQLEFLSGGEVHVLYPSQTNQSTENQIPTVFDVLPESLAIQKLNHIQQALTTGQRQTYEHQIEINHQIRWEEVRVAPLNQNEAIVIIRDITDRKQAEAAFRHLVEGAAAISGENFFAELTQYIATTLQVRTVIISKREADHMETYGFWANGKLQHNTTFPYINAPCTVTFESGQYSCLSVLQQQFPDNPMLKELQAESYIGVALTNTEGAITGCLCILNDQPFTQPQVITDMLRVFAARISSELERQAAIDALKRLNEELEDRILQRTIELSTFKYALDEATIVAVTDPEGIITYANDRFCQISKYSRTELIGNTHRLVNSGYHSKDFFAAMWATIRSGKTWRGEIQNRAKDGGEYWVDTTIVPFLDDQGQPVQYLAIRTDITARKQAELELQKLTVSLQNAMEGISRLDKQGRYLSVNRAYAAPCGCEPEELIGAEWQKTVYPEDIPLLESAYQVMLAQGKVEAEARGIRKDGSLFYKRVTMVTALDREGQFDGHYCFMKDISDRKATEAALQRQLAVIEAAIDGIAILEDDIFTYLNKAHLELFGYERPEELLGKNWRILYTPQELHRFDQDILPVLGQQHYWHGEAIAIRKDGSTFHEGVSLTLTDSGALICVCRDITEQKQAEAKVRQANDQLVLANAELARATRLKDEFLANMSHELRTPLNAILGMAEGLQEEVFGQISESQERAIATIERSGKHLLELINDILDLSKIESGKLDLQIAPVSVKHLCETSLTFVRQLAVRKSIRLTADIPATLPDIAVDERRIRQVLINLLNNAVKFTPEGGSVQLIARRESHNAHCSIRFQIRDTGIGIAPENLNKLFQPFVQIDSSLARQYTGTGLGLAMVRQLTQLHGGTVTVTSETGQGSCFTVTIPYLDILEDLPPPIAQVTESVTPSANNTILVIEDAPSAAEQTTRYLAEMDLHTVVHPVGRGALEAAIATQPALIILDILLPDLSGWQVLTQLKSHPQTQTIPVVIASVVDERSRAVALGASECLVKPINRSQLQTALQTFQIGIPPQSATSTTAQEPTPVAPLILLAEDNAANVTTFSGYLTHRGFQLILANDGAEAVALTESHHPDLILMDIQMPKVDGITAIRQIRANPAIAHIPIVALTALAMPSDQEKCIEAGANAYMTKPVKLKALAEIVQRLLAAEA